MQDVIAAETMAGGGGAGRIQSLPRPERNEWHFQCSKDPCHALCTGKCCMLHSDLHMAGVDNHKHCKQPSGQQFPCIFLIRLSKTASAKTVSTV